MLCEPLKIIMIEASVCRYIMQNVCSLKAEMLHFLLEYIAKNTKIATMKLFVDLFRLSVRERQQILD